MAAHLVNCEQSIIGEKSRRAACWYVTAIEVVMSVSVCMHMYMILCAVVLMLML